MLPETLAPQQVELRQGISIRRSGFEYSVIWKEAVLKDRGLSDTFFVEVPKNQGRSGQGSRHASVDSELLFSQPNMSEHADDE